MDFKNKEKGKKLQNIYELFHPAKTHVLLCNPMKCAREKKMTKFRLFGGSLYSTCWIIIPDV